jgi:xylulokinase
VEAAASLPVVGAPREVRVIGGNSRNPLFLSIKASALETPISVLDEAEATSLGAALLGGIGAGVWPDLDLAVAELARRQRIVEPDPVAAPLYKSLYENVFHDLQTSLKPINKELAVLDQKPAPAA